MEGRAKEKIEGRRRAVGVVFKRMGAHLIRGRNSDKEDLDLESRTRRDPVWVPVVLPKRTREFWAER